MRRQTWGPDRGRASVPEPAPELDWEPVLELTQGPEPAALRARRPEPVPRPEVLRPEVLELAAGPLEVVAVLADPST